MAEYLRNPEFVSAVQWDGSKEALKELSELPGFKFLAVYIWLETVTGEKRVALGDWVVRGRNGVEIVPDLLFAQSFEPVPS